MSWLDLFLRWRSSRLRFRLFLPLAIALAGFALLLRQAAGVPRSFDWPGLLGLVGLAFTVLAQFRLLDELADRDYDRRRHPERLLVRQESLRPFFVALALLALANLALAAALLSPRAALALALLDSAMPTLYALSRWSRWPRLLHAHTVLLKYPGCIYCLAGAPAAPGAAGGRLLAGAFLLAAIYELGHDSELRALPGGRALLLAAVLLIGTLWLWPLLRPVEAGP